MTRVLLRPLHLSNDTLLPTGTRVLAPSSAVSRSPTLWTDPLAFDGLRHYKLRTQLFASAEASAESSKEQARHTFAASSAEYLHWGYGRHACPGRFFADNEVKIILAEMVLRYDFGLKEGEGRPKNLGFEDEVSACSYFFLSFVDLDVLTVASNFFSLKSFVLLFRGCSI